MKLYEKTGEYQGREVDLESPFRLSGDDDKKFGVYVKNDKGNIVKVKFGSGDMSIKRDSDSHRKSFRARHKCDDDPPKDKTSARYWSCKMWQKGKTVGDMLDERSFHARCMLREIIRSEMKSVLNERAISRFEEGEPETGFLAAGERRELGMGQGKPEKWFHKEGWTQLDFPVADAIYRQGEEEGFQATKRVKGLPRELDNVESQVATNATDKEFLKRVDQKVQKKIQKLIGQKEDGEQ